MTNKQRAQADVEVYGYDINTAGVMSDAQLARLEYANLPPAPDPPVRRPPTVVLPERQRHRDMNDMLGAANLATLADAPAGVTVSIQTTYVDRAVGFKISTTPVWWVVCGSAAALVLLAWIIGPLTGRWAFAFGWWLSSEIAVLAFTSLAVWGFMWFRWHHDSPDAIAARAADARLEMARAWFYRELKRTYEEDKLDVR